MLRTAFFAAASVAALGLTGCGPKFSEVKGVVKLDGQPLEGATVTLLSDDGKKSYYGLSDASGNFEIKSADKPGAPAGSYKVTVVKTKMAAGTATMSAGGAEYMKMMETKAKESEKATSTKGKFLGPPPPGQNEKQAQSASEIPIQYGAVGTTPLSVTVPVSGPVTLDLTTPGKKK